MANRFAAASLMRSRWPWARPLPVPLMVLALLNACASPLPALRAIDPTAHGTAPNQSLLPLYESTGSVWVAGQALLIGSDYDFGLALADETYGPGLAAGQRKRHNAETAERFGQLAPLPLADLWRASLAATTEWSPEDRDWLHRQADVVVFGILFGAPDAQLRVVLEIGAARAEWISATHPLAGTNSWSGDRGDRLRATFRDALAQLLPMLLLQRLAVPAQAPQSYRIVADGIAPVGGLGWILDRSNDRVIVRSKSMPGTLYSYPETTFQSLGPLAGP